MYLQPKKRRQAVQKTPKNKMEKIQNIELLKDAIINYIHTNSIHDEYDDTIDDDELYEDENGDIHYATYYQWEKGGEDRIQKFTKLMDKKELAQEIVKEFEFIASKNDIDDIPEEEKSLAIQCEMYLQELSNKN